MARCKRFATAIGRTFFRLRYLAVTLTLPALAATTHGQLPVTELNTIYPSGGKQGSQLEVSVAGAHQDDLRAMVFSHAGLTAEQKVNPPGEFDRGPQPVNNVFTVRIAPDTPPGIYEARVVGRYGASNPRAFVVGKREELLDDGSNKSQETAREIPLGATVNGRVDGSSADYYKLKLNSGQRVLIKCLAEQIDSRMDANLVIYDAQGNELDRKRDTKGSDPILDFTAPAYGDYIVELHDFVYDGGGDYFYRLTAHTSPHIDYVLPPAGLPGTTASLIAYGRNLPGGKPAVGVNIDGAPLEQVAINVPIPQSDVIGASAGSMRLRPNCATVDCFEFRLDDSNPVRIGVAAAPVVLEKEPNDDAGSAQIVEAPCELAAQFYGAADDDWIEFAAKKGDVFWIEVLAHRLGLDCDPVMFVQKVTKNENGEEVVAEVAQVDDPGDRNGRIGSDFDTSTDDPSYRLVVNEDAVYRVLVRDNFGNSRVDPRFVYRLQIRPERPDFRLAVVPLQIKVANNNVVSMFSPVLRRGGTTLMRVDIERQDGFAGDVEISAEGLPAGVTCRGALVDASTKSTWLVFAAAEDAAAWTGSIRVLGKAQINGQEVTRPAVGGAVVWGTGNRTQTAADFRVTDQIGLSVTDKETHVAFAEVGDGAVLETSKGGKIDVPVKLVRRNEFKENVKLVATGVPNEVKPGDITINGDKNEGALSIAITNAKAIPGVYTFYLQGDTKTKYTPNPEAVAEAEADQKHVADLAASIGEEFKQATTAKDSAVKAAADAAGALKQAEQAKANAESAAKQAAEALAQAEAKLNEAKQAAEKEAENQALQEAVAAAQQTVDQAATKSKEEADKAAAAAAALVEAQNQMKAAEEAKAKAEANFTQMEEKQKRAAAAKQAADKRVADVKKANEPKDVNIALVSTPIKLRVVATPIGMKVSPPENALKQGAKLELPVALERKYGFAEAVEITVEPPKGVNGLSAAKLSVPKEQAEGKIELTAANDAAEGTHTLTIRAKAKFNNVDVETTSQVSVAVEKPEPAAEE